MPRPLSQVMMTKNPRRIQASVQNVKGPMDGLVWEEEVMEKMFQGTVKRETKRGQILRQNQKILFPVPDLRIPLPSFPRPQKKPIR